MQRFCTAERIPAQPTPGVVEEADRAINKPWAKLADRVLEPEHVEIDLHLIADKHKAETRRVIESWQMLGTRQCR